MKKIYIRTSLVNALTLKNKKGSAAGFTLVELIVVIAIIGLLATVILASLINARDKGRDSNVQSNLRNAMSQAEIFMGTNTVARDTYTNVCTNGIIGGANAVGNLILAAAKATGLIDYNINGVPSSASTSLASCNDSSLAWAAEAPLRTAGQMWCVDSAGKSKFETVSIGAATVCP